MAFRIDGGGFVNNAQETFKKLEIKYNPPPQENNQGAGSKIGESNFYGNALKSSLNKTVDVPKISDNSNSGGGKLSLYDALDKINKLPVRDINDSASVRQYNQQRATLADEALKTAVSPQRNDFKGLNARTADYEYREAKSYFDSQSSKLKSISDEAKADPSKLPLDAALTTSQAIDRINRLPTPSLNDKVATREYQRQRATIADAALAGAAPPNRDDYKGLPGRLGGMEYRDALSSYSSDITALKGISTAANADLNSSPTAVLDDSAKRVWDAAKNDPQAGALALAQEVQNLNAKYGPEAGGQLLGKLYQDSKGVDYDHDLNNILTFAGGNKTNGISQSGLPEDQRNAIGTAIGQAYDKMSADDKKDFVKNLVATTELNGFRGNAIGGDPNRIADLVSRSGSESLKTEMVNALTKRMVEIQPRAFGNNGGADIKALANSAAIIAGSGADSKSQVAMFDTIIKSFPQMNGDQLKSLMGDPALKDHLSQIFINNSSEIVHSLTNQAGGLRDANSSDGLRQFFEMTMFSKNPGQLRDQVMGEAVKAISRFADPSAASTDGRSKSDDARTAGSLVGLVQAAALNKKGEIQDDQKSREETTKMFVGMAFSFVPGASEALGEGSGKLLEFAYGKAVDFAQEHAESGLSGVINNLSDGDSLKNIDDGFKAIRDLRFQVSNSLENNDQLYNAFNDGYTVTGVDQLFAKEFGG